MDTILFKQEEWIQVNQQENLRLLSNPKSGQLVFERICSLPENEKVFNSLDFLNRRLKMNSKYNLSLFDYCLLETDSNKTFQKKNVIVRYEAFAQGLNKEFIDHVKKNQKWREKELLETMRCVLSALEELHSNNLVHGDLKMSSIVLTESGQIKLADQFCVNFSNMCQSSQIHKDSKLLALTSALLSPESLQLLNKQKGEIIMSFEDDLWALGIILLEMGLLENVHSYIYDYEQSALDLDKLEKKILKFKRILPKNSKILDLLLILLSPIPSKRKEGYQYFKSKKLKRQIIPPKKQKLLQVQDKQTPIYQIIQQHIIHKPFESQTIPELEEKDEQEDYEQELLINKLNLQYPPYNNQEPLLLNHEEEEYTSQSQDFLPCEEKRSMNLEIKGNDTPNKFKLPLCTNTQEQIISKENNQLLQETSILVIHDQKKNNLSHSSQTLINNNDQQKLSTSTAFIHEIIPPINKDIQFKELAHSVDFSTAPSMSTSIEYKPLADQRIRQYSKEISSIQAPKIFNKLKDQTEKGSFHKSNQRQSQAQYQEQDENINISNASTVSSKQFPQQIQQGQQINFSKAKNNGFSSPIFNQFNLQHSFTPSDKIAKGVFLLNSSAPNLSQSLNMNKFNSNSIRQTHNLSAEQPCNSGFVDLLNSISPIKDSHSKFTFNNSLMNDSNLRENGNLSASQQLQQSSKEEAINAEDRLAQLGHICKDVLSKSVKNRIKVQQIIDQRHPTYQNNQQKIFLLRQEINNVHEMLPQRKSTKDKEQPSSPSLSATSAHLGSTSSYCCSHNCSCSLSTANQKSLNCKECSNYHNILAFSQKDLSLSNISPDQSLQLSAHYGSLALSHLVNYISSQQGKNNSPLQAQTAACANNNLKLLSALFNINNDAREHSVSTYAQSSDLPAPPNN